MTKGPDKAFSFALEPAREVPELAEVWQGLELQAAPSFFVSWGWIGTWLAELPGSFEPLCLTVRHGRETVGLGLLVPRTKRLAGVTVARQLWLHATGDPDLDQLAIEYNGLLVKPRFAETLPGRCARYLLDQGWDELHVDAIEAARMPGDCLGGCRVSARKRQPAPFVDLTRLAGEDLLAHVGRNTRHQIRRSRRLYGDVTAQVASSLHQAWETWDQLTDLHQRRWAGLGQAGAFSSPSFRAFHRRLIAERFGSGEVQLLLCRGDGGTIGCLYNFVHRGTVYAYQSGFVFNKDNRLKPGLVSHHEAIGLNHGFGHRRYDFLAGEARYKRSLATDCTELAWAVVRRKKRLSWLGSTREAVSPTGRNGNGRQGPSK